MRPTVLGLAAVIAATAQPALAQAQPSQADRDDARCVLIMNLLAQQPDQQRPASMGLFYFLGRIDQRGAGDKLESLLQSERKGLDDETKFKAEFARCGDIMTKRSASLNAMYDRLEAAEKAAAPPAKPPAK